MKYTSIPNGYMTVGQVAKKMNITVRTLQYYDKEGLISPSSKSNGGRRLYNDKDLIKLHQILSLKSLGFSLENIKKQLISLDSPKDVADALTKQADDIRRKINDLSESLEEIEKLKIEVLKMQSVDFKKYADIIVNLQMKNEFYYLIKCFDEKTLDHIRNHFDKESGLAFMEKFNNLSDEIIKLQKDDVPPNSKESQYLAKEFWEMIMEFTNGDMSLLPNLIEIGNFDDTENEWKQRQALVNAYIEPALEIYFSNLNINPFEEKENE